MVSIVIFGVPLSLIVVFLSFKAFEMRRGIRFAPRVRNRADEFVMRVHSHVREWTQDLVTRTSLQRILNLAVHYTATGTARAAEAVERYAHTIAKRVSHSHTHSHKGAETRSDFLKEITNHKNNLDTESVKRDTRL